VWRFGLWAKIVAIIVSLLVAVAFFWTPFGLMSPTSFFDFMSGVLIIPGALLTIVGSVAAMVARRHGNLTEIPRAGEARGIRVVVGVVALLAVVSGVLTLVSRSTVEAAAQVRQPVRAFEARERIGERRRHDALSSVIRNDDQHAGKVLRALLGPVPCDPDVTRKLVRELSGRLRPTAYSR
jgi:hypothetical protein